VVHWNSCDGAKLPIEQPASSASFLYDQLFSINHQTTQSCRSLKSAGAIGEGIDDECRIVVDERSLYLAEIALFGWEHPMWPAQKKTECSVPNAKHCKSRWKVKSSDGSDKDTVVTLLEKKQCIKKITLPAVIVHSYQLMSTTTTTPGRFCLDKCLRLYQPIINVVRMAALAVFEFWPFSVQIGTRPKGRFLKNFVRIGIKAFCNNPGSCANSIISFTPLFQTQLDRSSYRGSAVLSPPQTSARTPPSSSHVLSQHFSASVTKCDRGPIYLYLTYLNYYQKNTRKLLRLCTRCYVLSLVWIESKLS